MQKKNIFFYLCFQLFVTVAVLSCYFSFFFLCRLRPLTYGINIIPLAGAFLQGTANETEKFNISAPKTKSNEETGTKKKRLFIVFASILSPWCVYVYVYFYVQWFFVPNEYSRRDTLHDIERANIGIDTFLFFLFSSLKKKIQHFECAILQ